MAVSVFDTIKKRSPHEFGIQERPVKRDTQRVYQTENPVGFTHGKQMSSLRDQDRDDDIQKHCLAVQQMIFMTSLKPVAEGVAEVHRTHEVAFEQIRLKFLEDAGNGTTENRFPGVVLKAGVDALRTMHLEQMEQMRVFDNGQLDDFADTVQDVTARQSFQESSIQKDPQGRLEAPQTILVTVEVDSVLDAYGSVDVSHEGGGYLDMRNATAVAAGDITDDIGQDTTADRDDRLVSTMDGKRVKLAQEIKIAIERLVYFTAGKKDNLGVDLPMSEIGRDLLATVLRHLAIQHHEPSPPLEPAGQKERRALG